jgi:hypothetical protein
LIVADPPELAELEVLLELAPEVELELELEPHAAIPSDAASASATAEMRLEFKVYLLIRVQQSLRASGAPGVNQL